MSKKIMLIWGLIIVTIVLGMLTYGICYKKKHPYMNIEHQIKDSAKEYMKDYKGIKPDEFIDLTITVEELQKSGNLGKLKYKDKTCTGKVVIELKNRRYKYNTSVKCK